MQPAREGTDKRAADLAARKTPAISKGGLAILLSRLKGFETPNVRSEQYATDPEVAATVLWQAYQLGDLEGKVSADLGCGTGLLGIGMLALGARKVYFVEQDKTALLAAKKNLETLRSESSLGLGQATWVVGNVDGFDRQVDLVMQNPPFGTKVRHQDREFLRKAMHVAPVVWSFHKTSTAGFVKGFAKVEGFEQTHRLDFEFPLKQTQKFHTRRIFRIKVSCMRFERTPAEPLQPGHGTRVSAG